jgi:hypothetical protein
MATNTGKIKHDCTQLHFLTVIISPEHSNVADLSCNIQQYCCWGEGRESVKAKGRNNLITWRSGGKSVWLTNASRCVAENVWINFRFGWQGSGVLPECYGIKSSPDLSHLPRIPYSAVMLKPDVNVTSRFKFISFLLTSGAF